MDIAIIGPEGWYEILDMDLAADEAEAEALNVAAASITSTCASAPSGVSGP